MEDFIEKLKELQRLGRNIYTSNLVLMTLLDGRDTKSLSVSSSLIAYVLSYYFKVKAFKRTIYFDDAVGQLEYGKESVICALGLQDDVSSFSKAYQLTVAAFEKYRKTRTPGLEGRAKLYHFVTQIEIVLLVELNGNVDQADRKVLDAYDQLFPITIENGVVPFIRKRSRQDFVQLGVRWNYHKSEPLRQLEIDHLTYSASKI